MTRGKYVCFFKKINHEDAEGHGVDKEERINQGGQESRELEKR
ncbi:MAG: hypothetical protein R3A13_01655 [Bdellovibrionota bacterium]